MPSGTQQANIVLVARSFIVNDHQEILFLQRNKSDNHNPEQWEVPGGKLEPGQSLPEARNAEVLQETNLLIKPISDISYTTSRIIQDGRYYGYTYVAIFNLSKVAGGQLKLSEEHQSADWVRPHNSLTLPLTTETRRALICLIHYMD